MPLGSAVLLVVFGGPAMAQEFSPSTPGDLTISEFMAEPQVIANYNGEWFEIYNASGRNLDLNGLGIQGSSLDDGFQINTETVLPAGAYFVFGVQEDTSLNGNVPVDYEYARALLDLEHTGDTLRLTFGGVTIDEVEWDTAAGWDVDLLRSHQANRNAFDLEWANDLPHNWCQANNEDIASSGWYGTPGEANSLCNGSGDDADGDGFTEASVPADCDDEDAYVNPDAIDGSGDPYGNVNDDADCDGVRDDGEDDDDGDGYAEVQGDCDDGDPTVSPAEEELYDSYDNDCNGCVDDVDDDNDGWTECSSDEVVDCDAADDVDCETDFVPGACALAYDCDDGNNLAYPCFDESVRDDFGEYGFAYDGVDQSCDGYDECDIDGDGYESDECPDISVQYPEKARDCDDLNDAVHPGQSEGDPSQGGVPDGLDNDCNGTVDDPYQDLDGDNYTVADGDCLDDPTVDGSDQAYPGAEELCTDLIDNDCDGLVNEDCVNPVGYATVQGGGVCGVVGGAAGGSFLLTLLSLVLAGGRRRAED